MNDYNCYVNEPGTEKCPRYSWRNVAHNDTETDESNITSQSVMEQQQPCLPLRLYRDGELSHGNSGSLI